MRRSVRRMRRLVWLGHGLTVVGLAGCRRDAASSVSDDVYIATMADLRIVQIDSTLTDPARAAARTAVLTKHRVTAEQLEATATSLADNPNR
ncbi:MAG: hypothetical protein ABJD07_14970, partial [Gemmatimonadaceae bacterium]